MAGRPTRGYWQELLTGRRTLALAMLGLAFGVNSLPFYTSGLFINALHAERGWSLSGLSLGPTLLVAIMALSAPALGHAFDRHGERRFIVSGLLMLAAGFLLLSRIESLLEYWLATSAMALLAGGASTPAYLRIVNRTFDASKGAALALTITGAALFSAIVPPLLQMVITDHGWRTGYLGLAVAVLVAVPLIMLLLGPVAAPRPVPTAAPATPVPHFRYRALLTSRPFLLTASTVVAVSLACPGLLIHFAPLLTKGGYTAQDAAWMMGLIGIAQIVSRLSTGMLIDRFFAPYIAATIMVVSASGIALMAWGGIGWSAVGAVAVGLAYGAEADVVGYFVGRYYSAQHFGRIFGLLYALSLASAAVSPIGYGVVVDRLDSYAPVLAGAAVLLFIAAGLFLRLPAFPGQRKDPRLD